MDFKEEELVALKAQVASVLKSIEEARSNYKDVPDRRLNSGDIKKDCNFHLARYDELKDYYNIFVEQRDLSPIVKMDDFDDIENLENFGIARGRLSELIRNLETAKKVLDKVENKAVETDKVVQLTSIKDTMEDELTDTHPILQTNLVKSIDALEDGHPKPASITAGAVIDHIMDELKSELGVGDWNEAIEELESRGTIDESTDGRVHRALKKSRDKLSHDLETDPDVNSTIHLISGAVQLLNQVSEIDDISVAVNESEVK